MGPVARDVNDEGLGGALADLEDLVEPVLVLADLESIRVEKPLDPGVEKDRFDVGEGEQGADEGPVAGQVQVGRRAGDESALRSVLGPARNSCPAGLMGHVPLHPAARPEADVADADRARSGESWPTAATEAWDEFHGFRGAE